MILHTITRKGNIVGTTTSSAEASAYLQSHPDTEVSTAEQAHITTHSSTLPRLMESNPRPAGELLQQN